MNHPTPFEPGRPDPADMQKKLKIGIILGFVALLILGGISMLLIPLLDDLNLKLQQVEIETYKDPSIIFVERNDDYNVYKDEVYLQYTRHIVYTNAQSGESVILEEDDLYKYNPAVTVLYEMIQSIINGDEKSYNALFSSTYYESNEPEAPFRMQPLYDIQITRLMETNMDTHTVYELDVEYKICWNDGTFRTDIGHHQTRKQRFILSDSGNSGVLIDQIQYYITVR